MANTTTPENKIFSQLGLIERVKFLTLLTQKVSMKVISLIMGVARQTLYRELKRNCRIVNHDTYDAKYSCAKFIECHRGIKTFCPKDCPNYVSETCALLTKYPFVCNFCPKRARCKKQQAFYDPEYAQKEYRHVLKHSRNHCRLDESVVTSVNEVVPDLINNGHSVEAIMMGHPELQLSSSTLRRWILTRKVDNCSPSKFRMAGRRKISKKYDYSVNLEHKVLSKEKEGHKYGDYLLYVHEHPEALVVQIDTVIGKRDDSKSVLTIHVVNHHFMFGFLLERHTSAVVRAKIDYLFDQLKSADERLGTNLYERFSEVLLTDNGVEFDGLLELNDGVSHVFYCHPYSSFEKGSIERNHVLVRYIQWKGETMEDLTQEKVDLIFSHINSYPRKALNKKTPYQSVCEDLGMEFINATGITQVAYDDVILNPSLIKKTK